MVMGRSGVISIGVIRCGAGAADYLWFWCLHVLWSSRVRGRSGGGGLGSTEKMGSVHGHPAYPGFWVSNRTGVFHQSWEPGYGNKGRRGVWGR